MFTVGIDVGTSSVRLCGKGDNIKIQDERPINIYKSEKHPNIATQSSIEIFTSIVEMLRNLKIVPDAISITATCSMVVLKKFSKCSGTYLEPFPVDSDQKSQYQDIILWMDGRATKEVEKLNANSSFKDKQKVGGSFIPEMGLAKLKWLSDNVVEQLVCFELYDWFTYLLLVGGFSEDLTISYLNGHDGQLSKYERKPGSMDGSIKGCSKMQLQALGIADHIEIGSSDFNIDKKEGLLPVGTPLGFMDYNILSRKKEVLVAHGCIDSYAGWVSTLDTGSLGRSEISMIAGTSTCFILASQGLRSESFKSIWGPFDQLMSIPSELYEFGQPATGKLFENLFENYKTVLPNAKADIFGLMEQETQVLESKYGTDINTLIKNYFWYADQHGNRSPYNDFSMSEVLIDGCNSSPYLPSITNGLTLVALVIRYNLILEFLCFQTKQILDLFLPRIPQKISCIKLVGSQSKNTRFKKLLATITKLPIKSLSQDESMKFMVSRGSSTIAELACYLYDSSISYSKALSQSLSEITSDTSTLLPASCFNLNEHLLFKKYEVFKDICDSQRRYRNMLA